MQGVGFRWFVREQARARGIAGWVRNLSDGCVEIQAAGSADALSELVTAVRSGPPAAHVTDVITLQAEVVETLKVPFVALR